MSYEIRSMSLGEILDTGFRLLRDHFVLLVGISAILQLPLTALGLGFQPAAGAIPDPQEVLVLVGVSVLAFALLNPLVIAAATHAIGQSYLGRETSVGECLGVGMRIFLPLVGTSLIAAVAQLAGFALLIVPGVYLYLAFLLIQQVMVLERVFGIGALVRSHELMKGHKGRGFGIVLVSGILVGVLGAGVGFVANFIPIFGVLLSALANAVGYAFMMSVLVLLYFDIRCRKEAFDLEHLSRVVEGETHARPTVTG